MAWYFLFYVVLPLVWLTMALIVLALLALGGAVVFRRLGKKSVRRPSAQKRLDGKLWRSRS